MTTAAVTCGGEPRLLLNPEFLERHCQTEAHVKAVICHEFLHVLLRHTEGRGPRSWAEHLALDAVINAIIHRTLGAEYSSFMSLFYARAQGVAKLLRPCPPGGHVTVRATLDRYGRKPPLEAAWSALYDGRLLADDIRSLANDFANQDERRTRWLGDHSAPGAQAERGASSGPVREALERALRSMNGSGIWRDPNGRGVGQEAYSARLTAADIAVERWRREAWRVLRRHLVPDRRAPRWKTRRRNCACLCLSPSDRRSFSRALWSPFAARGAVEQPAAHRRCQRAGLPRRQRFDEQGDAADHRAARAPRLPHPPAVLGLQRRGGTGRDPATNACTPTPPAAPAWPACCATWRRRARVRPWW